MKRKIRISPRRDLEYKHRSEELPTPPRPSSPISEAPPELPAPPDLEPDKVKVEIDDEKNEVAKGKESPTTTKKQKIEEEEKERRDKEEEKKSEEMVHDEVEEETTVADDADGPKEDKEEKDDFDLPELKTASKKLDHVTKGRPRPARRAQRKPVVKETETDEGVDNFFSASVQSTNFDNVLTLEEEKKEAAKEAKEKTPKKPMGVGLPGMGPITPEMLRRKKKAPNTEEKNDEEVKQPESPKEKKEEDDEKNGVEEEDGKPAPEPVVKKKPAGAMGLPGMGFGGNVLAEMKLKKLNKSKSPEPNHDEPKSDSDHTPFKFGPSMLKKTNHATSPPATEKTETNSNNNNSKDWTKLRSTPNRFKSKSFEREEKPEITVKSKTPILPPKPTPPPASSKPGKGAPPPLPNKPKPTALRPDSELRGGRARPVSEFVDPKKIPSSVKSRAASWGKKTSDEKA